jgi:c-di-GMP-binding flagellar brake protein YcgR
VPAVFAVKNTADRAVYLGQAEDIGVTGMALRWPKDATLMTSSPVTLTFQLPGSREPIAASVLVVNDRYAGRFRRTGVRFTAIEPHHAELIARYCASRRA